MKKQDTARIPMIVPTEWNAEARDAFAVLSSSATKTFGAASNMAMTFAHHPKLAKAYYTLGRYLALDSSLPPRLRELATLRVSWLIKSQYEWSHHVRSGKKIGLTDREIDAVKQGSEAAVWTETEICVLRLTDELYRQHKVSDTTWNELNRLMELQQVMDLVFTIGHYISTALTLNAFNIDIEPGFNSEEHPLDPAAD